MAWIERHGTAVAMAAFALVAVAGVLLRPLLPVDETRYLAVAWEMRQHGDWLVPHLNGAVYSDKPPLLFWVVNLVRTVTGVSETAGRLVGPAFGVASIAATAALARRLWPVEAGIGGRAALALAGSAFFTLFAGLTMFDAMLTLAVVLGMLALAAADRWPRAWIGLGAALALGAFAKGPVVLIHLLPAALLTPLWAGEPWRAALSRAGRAVGLGLGLVALWLIPAVLTGGPEYRSAVLWTQSAGRVANSFAHGKPLWFFIALLPLLLWPWGWAPALWGRVARLPWRGDRGLRLCLVWAGATLVLFSLISGKQVHYLLPAMPAAALICARALAGRPVGAMPAVLLPLLLGGLLLALGLGLGPAGLAAQVPAGAGAAGAGVLLLGLAVAAVRLRGPALALLGPALVLGLDLAFVGALGTAYDAGPIARLIASHDGKVALLGQGYSGEFSFTARLRQPVKELGSLPEALDWLAATPGGILVARTDRPHPDTEPTARIDYNARPFGIWLARKG